jgi:hypothetical protein
MGQILEREILVSCDSVLQELSTNIFDIIYNTIIFDRDTCHAWTWMAICIIRIVITEISSQRNLLHKRWKADYLAIKEMLITQQ